MRNIEEILKSIFGKGNYLKIKEIKNSILPNRNRINEKQLNIKRSNFYSQFVNKNELCFDIGANMGNRIVPLLSIGAKVIAIEPQRECYNFLKWKFKNKIEIVTKGISSKNEIRDFYISNSSTISSFSEDWIKAVKKDRFKAYNWNKVEKIEMITLDDLISNYGLPSFIKVDVEGFEEEVLKGLTKKIKTICFEYTTPELTENIFKCANLLHKINNSVQFNYTIGENTRWASKKWFDMQEFNELINKKEFQDTRFGDIYARNNSGYEE
jgi:FkbM family methyltransferase